jgi:hypothetical protein
MIIAVLSSIYISYELFRVIYNTVFLDRIFIKGDQLLSFYRIELLLCVYTFCYWTYFFIKHFLQVIRKLNI